MTAIERNWYELICDGYKELEDVPRKIKPNVEKALKENGYFKQDNK